MQSSLKQYRNATRMLQSAKTCIRKTIAVNKISRKTPSAVYIYISGN